MDRSAIRRQVEAELRMETALAALYGVTVGAPDVMAELRRMARESRAPGNLEALFAALDNDPVAVAECLGRPILVERRLRSAFAVDPRWPAQDFDSWWRQMSGIWSTSKSLLDSDMLYLPSVKGLAKSDPANDLGGWQANAKPEPRSGHMAVWTGSEMLIVGGTTVGPVGYRYDPVVDVWTPMSQEGQPGDLTGATAIWSGSELIVWGGNQLAPTNAGARYDPAFDLWTPTNTEGAPTGRLGHTAVWSGQEMLIWGGPNASGGRFDPSTDSWLPMTSDQAPAAFSSLQAVWTGDAMLFWGDFGNNGSGVAAMYDPVADAWTASVAAPFLVSGPPVWSGEEMITWGYCEMATCSDAAGVRYDPSLDEWTPMTSVDQPDLRFGHTLVWADGEAIVWGGGGSFDLLDSGARYAPASDSWTATPQGGAPGGRYEHTAVWTGEEMIVWGGRTDTSNTSVLGSGGRLDPSDAQWVATAAVDAPQRRRSHSTVWTGQEMIVWGGVDPVFLLASGGRYEPMTATWTATSLQDAPSARGNHTAVWTGTQMIVWGGTDATASGGHYNPSTGQWSATATGNAPSARQLHSAVWTGSRMIIWGGRDNVSQFGDGASYAPGTGQWTTLSALNAPEPRFGHTAVWTGARMIVWGGSGIQSGGVYDPIGDAWQPTSLAGAPSPRTDHSAIWTGQDMIVWGGSPLTNEGALYRPGLDQWTATSLVDAPVSRWSHSAIWTGREMIVWGGTRGIFAFEPILLKSGGRFDPGSNSWAATAELTAPPARSMHSAVWTGEHMIVWGGCCTLDSMGTYDPALLTKVFRDGFE